MVPVRTSTLETARRRGLATARRGGSFLVVGAAGYLVDAATYNVLVFGGPAGVGLLHELPLLAKVVAIIVASGVTYAGNRMWTFRERRRIGLAREYVMFVMVNLMAIGLALIPLAVSRYALDLSSALADNIAGNLVGQTLATVFRFWAYGRWVFPADASQKPTVN